MCYSGADGWWQLFATGLLFATGTFGGRTPMAEIMSGAGCRTEKVCPAEFGHTRHAACDDSRQRQPRGSQIHFWILGLLGSVPIPRFPVSASASAAAIRRWTASDCSMSSATPCLRFVSCHVARAPIQGTHKWISSVLAVVWQNVRVKRRVLLTCPSSL